jgi:UDPglucose 6-dehydrogenase
MDIASAEMTKYAANSMLATRISFMNQIAELCEQTGADIELVRKGVGSDKRIGKAFLYAGTGYGGSCFPKDVLALIQTADDLGVDLTLLKAVHEANEEQKSVLLKKIARVFGDDLSGRRFALDPVAMDVAREMHFGDSIEYFPDAYSVCRDADALVLVTEWLQYRRPDWGAIQGALKAPIVFDGRNMFEPVRMRELGIQYYSIGRGSVE